MRILGTPIPLLLTYYQHKNWKPCDLYESQAFNSYCHMGAEDRYIRNTITEMSARIKNNNFRDNYENLFIFCLDADFPTIDTSVDVYRKKNETEEIKYGEVDLFE